LTWSGRGPQQQIRQALANFRRADRWQRPGWLAAHGLDPAELRRQSTELIITSVSAFGQDGRTAIGRVPAGRLGAAGSLIRCGLPAAARLGRPYQLSYRDRRPDGSQRHLCRPGGAWSHRPGGLDRLLVLESVQAQADWSTPGYSTTGTAARARRAGPAVPDLPRRRRLGGG